MSAAAPPTMQVPGGYAAYEIEPWDGEGWISATGPRPTFRVKPLLVLTILTVLAVGVAVFTDVIDVGVQQSLGGPWKVNDFGTNLTVAAVASCLFMLVGALAWGFGYRWGAGLAGGAGTGLAGWAALVTGLAELPLAQARAGIGWSRRLRLLGPARRGRARAGDVRRVAHPRRQRRSGRARPHGSPRSGRWRRSPPRSAR